jgi:hypothetical protein
VSKPKKIEPYVLAGLTALALDQTDLGRNPRHLDDALAVVLAAAEVATGVLHSLPELIPDEPEPEPDREVTGLGPLFIRDPASGKSYQNHPVMSPDWYLEGRGDIEGQRLVRAADVPSHIRERLSKEQGVHA